VLPTMSSDAQDMSHLNIISSVIKIVILDNPPHTSDGSLLYLLDGNSGISLFDDLSRLLLRSSPVLSRASRDD